MSMVQSRAEPSQANAALGYGYLKLERCMQQVGSMDLKNKEERANRRFLGRVFMSFFGGHGDGFVLIWFYVRFSIFCIFVLLQGNWTTQRKMQTWEYV